MLSRWKSKSKVNHTLTELEPQRFQVLSKEWKSKPAIWLN